MQLSSNNSSLLFFVDGFSQPELAKSLVSSESAQKFLKQGQIMHSLERNDEALLQIDKAVENDPKLIEAYFLKGNIQRELGLKDLALQSYKQCERLETKQYYIYYNIGLLLEEMNLKEEAIKYLDISLQCFLKYETLINKGILCLQLQKYEDCQRTYEMAITLQPNCHIAYYGYGVTLFKMNKFQEALNQYNIALKLNPLQVNGFNNKAVTLCKLGEINEAIVNLQKGLKISGNDPILNLNLIKIHKLSKNVKQVNELKQKIKNIKPYWEELQSLEEMETAISNARTEIQFLQISNSDQFESLLNDFQVQYEEALKNLWNYDLEFEDTSKKFKQSDIEKIQQIIQESLNSEESTIKHLLIGLKNRVYFQSFYWRLLNYVKVASYMSKQQNKSKLQFYIDQVNKSNLPLLPQESDQQLYNSQLNQANETLLQSSYLQKRQIATSQSVSSIRKPSYYNSRKKSKLIQRKPYSEYRPKQFSPQPQPGSKSTIKSLSGSQGSISQFKSQKTEMQNKIQAQQIAEYIQLKPIPITEGVINLINEALEIKTFQDHIIFNILKVFANKAKNDQQLELEIQYAAYNMAQGNKEFRSFVNQVEQIQIIERNQNKELKYINEKDWFFGIDDTLQILNYFNQMCRTLIEPQQITLRFQISNGQSSGQRLKGNFKRGQTKAVEQSQESCTCHIF